MRITLDLDDALVGQAKKAAAEQGTTLTALIEDALRRQLDQPARAKKRRKLPVFEGDGLVAGVELHDTSKLLELLDDDVAR
jgi:hypothetical protein